MKISLRWNWWKRSVWWWARTWWKAGDRHCNVVERFVVAGEICDTSIEVAKSVRC